MKQPNGRTVTALVTYRDEDLGSIGPFGVASPGWADVDPVAAHLREVLGVNVVVLRLVDVDGGTSPRNGHVTYHAEALTRPARSRTAIRPELSAAAPGRASWATGSGIRAALAWADAALATGTRSPSHGSVAAIAEQAKTWNLSALFRIPTDAAPVWLKLTPPFAAHEPAVTAVIGAVAPDLVPPVIASDPVNHRVLLEHVPGEDCWDASPALIRATVTRWVAAQAAIAERPMPPSAVVPDRRPAHLVKGLTDLLDGAAGAQLTSDEMAGARELERRLPGMIEELSACGLPDTFVHGDFHPGNWRSDGKHTVLIDFADAYVGHPAFDGERLREFIDEERREPVAEAWCAAWAEHAPESDPKRALHLARPLQALSGAILYQQFLDNIETSERRYHELDPPAGIRDAIAATFE